MSDILVIFSCGDHVCKEHVCEDVVLAYRLVRVGTQTADVPIIDAIEEEPMDGGTLEDDGA